MPTFPQITSPPQAAAEVLVNRMGETLSGIAAYGKKQSTTLGLTWGGYGCDAYNGNVIADWQVSLTDNATNYIVVLRSTGVPSVSTSTTNGANPLYAKLYKVTTSGGVVIAVEDQRFDTNGLFQGAGTSSSQGDGLDVDASGFRGIPQNSQSGNYTTVAADNGKHIIHPSGAGSGDTVTIAANASVAYELGAAITFINMDSSAWSIAIASDTLYLAGAGTTGTRTLAQYGVATAVKVGSTSWLVSGTGIT